MTPDFLRVYPPNPDIQYPDVSMIICDHPCFFRLVFGVRLAFMLQVLCSFPLQMLPASRLIEGLFFERISDPPMARKLAKTGGRKLPWFVQKKKTPNPPGWGLN